MNALSKTSAVILASGASSRMNFPKALLNYDADRTFLEKIVEAYHSAAIDDITVVVNETIVERVASIFSKPAAEGKVAVLLNPFPERGRFYAIGTGLGAAAGDYCFLQNIDNPFVTGALLKMMRQMARANCYVVPGFKGKGGHPLLLSKNIARHLAEQREGGHDLRDQLRSFEKIWLPWNDEKILANINTEADYDNYFLSCKVYTED